MKRIMLVVAYDGTNYCGWQIQNNGPTIEEELNKALTHLLKEDIHVIGASRTDSGVHALGNVAVFDTDTRIPAEKICYAVNMGLPDDIVVQSSHEVPCGWHPRKCDSRKTYEYKILNRAMAMPTISHDSYFYHYPLDVEAMQRASGYFVGPHDFASFCSSGAEADSTVRTIYSCRVSRDGDMVKIRVCGNGFLYNMVRIMAGTLILVGAGKMKPDDMAGILRARDRRVAGPTAPAKGLTLIKIEYE